MLNAEALQDIQDRTKGEPTEAIKEGAEETLDLSEPEQKAYDSGWRPQEEWVAEGKDAEDWVTAKEFNRVGEMMDRIKSQTSQIRGQDKKINKLESTLEELAEHHKKVQEVEYKKAMEDLKTMKKDALAAYDHDQVVEIDEKISELRDVDPNKTPKQETYSAPESGDLHPEVEAWIDSNSWYTQDVVLRGAAEALADNLVKENPSYKDTPGELLNKVTETLQQEFPSKFGKPASKRQTVSEPGDGAVRSSVRPKKYSARQLNDEQAKVGKRFMASGAVKSLDEYAQQLADIGGLDSQLGE
jgi:archaellum component FlaC